MKQRFLISSAIEGQKLPNFSFDRQGVVYGKAHYSWKVVSALYHNGLQSAGFDVDDVVRPEIYQSTIAHHVFGKREGDVHLAIKPIEYMHTFYGMKNICVNGWEFPEFSKEMYGDNPMFDQINVLSKMDQVWCCSDFTRDNIKAHGLDNAITLPPPVLVYNDDYESVDSIPTVILRTDGHYSDADRSTLGDVIKEHRDHKIFLSILNPHDLRKQLDVMLMGFIQALEKNQNMLLIIKLVVESQRLENVQDVISGILGMNDLVSDKVVFTVSSLSRGQMRSLNRIAHFYLCTSSTEGLNLPLIEAMGQGVVPVSSNQTAMHDYINNDNAIILDAERCPTRGRYHFLHEYLPTTHFPPKLSSVTQGISYAVNLSDKDYKLMSDNAMKFVDERYSITGFVKRYMEICGGMA